MTKSQLRNTAIIVFLIAAWNMLLTNDYATFWAGAESNMVWKVLAGDPARALPDMLLQELGVHTGFSHFWLRLPAVIVFILSLIAFGFWGGPLFGRQQSWQIVLVLAASLALPNLVKRATGDGWLFSAHLMVFLFTLRYLKGSQPKWKYALYGALLFSLWISPWSSLLFYTGLIALLYFFHAQGRRLLKPDILLAFPVFVLILYLFDALRWSEDGFFMSGHYGTFVGISLLGFLPWTGFLMAGLWENTRRLGKREEMAAVQMAALGAALVAQSPVLGLLLALPAARHMEKYFLPGYPWRRLVKTGMLLHLVIVFCLIVILMIQAYLYYGGTGFRAGLAFGATYWMFSFIAGLGLLGERPTWVWTGTLVAGLLTSTLFWLQLYPLIETERDLPRELVEAASTRADAIDLYEPRLPALNQLSIYARLEGMDLKRLSDKNRLDSTVRPGAVLIAPIDEYHGQEEESEVIDTLRAWPNTAFSRAYVLFSIGALEDEVKQDQ